MGSLPGFEALPEGTHRHPGLEERESSPRLKAINRNQLLLRPVDVERLVPDDHEVRAIWEFTGRIDLTPYYQDIAAVEGKAGSTAFDPRLLISIWIYAYSKGIGSAREISRRIEYEPPYQWLTGMEPVSYHTLSDFRIANTQSLAQMFANILGILSAEGLITLERVMHDGTKVKACAGDDTFRSEGRIRAHLEAAKDQVRLLQESADTGMSPRIEKARERAAGEKQTRLESALQEFTKMEGKADARVSTTDPEARIMKLAHEGYAPAYNVQVTTDAHAGIIVAAGISQNSQDYKELVPAMKRIKENTGELPLTIVADAGYVSNDNILAMSREKIDFIGSLKGYNAAPSSNRPVDPAFSHEKFLYDPARNVYTCPVGKTLTYRRKNIRKGRTRFIYLAHMRDCGICTCREKCCPGKQRTIIRGMDDPAITAFREKMETEEARVIYAQRSAVAEFPNAWIKEKIGLRQFRLRGILKVGAEALWACVTYNIQQWVRLVWRAALV